VGDGEGRAGRWTHIIDKLEGGCNDKYLQPCGVEKISMLERKGTGAGGDLWGRVVVSWYFKVMGDRGRGKVDFEKKKKGGGGGGGGGGGEGNA